MADEQNIESATDLTTSTIFYTQSHTPIPTNTFTPTITQTFVPTFTATPLPITLNIPYTACGDHIAYSATTDIFKIHIVENDKIIEYADYVVISYKIKNTYVNTSINGFEVRPSPGYDDPDLYPDTLFNSQVPLQPNEEVMLKSENLFFSENWNSQDHPTAFLKFPQDFPTFHVLAYRGTVGGHTVFFQIVETFEFSQPDTVRCSGVIRIK